MAKVIFFLYQVDVCQNYSKLSSHFIPCMPRYQHQPKSPFLTTKSKNFLPIQFFLYSAKLQMRAQFTICVFSNQQFVLNYSKLNSLARFCLCNIDALNHQYNSDTNNKKKPAHVCPRVVPFICSVSFRASKLCQSNKQRKVLSFQTLLQSPFAHLDKVSSLVPSRLFLCAKSSRGHLSEIPRK